MKTTDIGRMTRRAALAGIAGGIVAATMGGQALASPSLNLGKGQFRRIRFVNSRLQEKLDAVYWIDGDYVPEALQEISSILRDWRAELIKPYHESALDVLTAAHQKLGADEPFEIVSGYRSPQTNAMMRRQSSGVARNSYHTRAMAVDVTLKSRSVRQIAGAAESLKAGGVGRYSRSDFVHMDCGPVRTWGA